MNYGIEAPDGGILYPNGRSKFVNDGWIWKWGKDKVNWGIKNKFLEFVKSRKSSNSKYTIKYKVYENVDNEGNLRKKIGRAFSNFILEPINQQGNAELASLFDSNIIFSNPKPIGLLKYLINTVVTNSGTILDFFAGSGTTLHATMQLNAEDGGHRQCILVTNNENGICENVTYERNKRVIQGYTTPKGEKIEGLIHNNLRYYKTKLIPRNKTTKNMRLLTSLSTDMLCIRNDVYFEKPFASKKINKSIAQYFENASGTRRMLVVYREEAVAVLVKLIATLPKCDEKLMVYVFSPNGYAYDEEFGEVADKVRLCAIPDAILNVYRRMLPKRKSQQQKDALEGVENELVEKDDANTDTNISKEGDKE